MPQSENALFILHHVEEMRHPYETALKPFCSQITWFTSQQKLIAAGAAISPAVVIVDLDALDRPLSDTFEKLRTTFAKSELIAISAEDSAKLATQCIHSGFADFLLKPTSPEELAWSIRKSSQRHEIYSRLDDPRTAMIRAAAQISSSATPALVRIATLQYLQRLFQAKGAAWVNLQRRRKKGKASEVLCALPQKAGAEKTAAVVERLAAPARTNSVDGPKRVRVLVAADGKKERKIIFSCEMTKSEALVFWGIPGRIPAPIKSDALFLIKHAELSLLNLLRFEEIKQQTFMDDLTGLYNSRYLKYALTNAILKSREPGKNFSVLFIDVDHFKSINDKHGHLVGSEFLVTIGKTIRNAVRSIDPVFRYGGDEFVVLLHDSGTEAAREIAERIRKNIERRVFVIHEKKIQTTVSVGLATFPDHASEHEAILRLADEAMYSAKKTSRNSVHLAAQPTPAPLRKAS